MGYSGIRNSRFEGRSKEVEPFEPFICGHYNWLPVKFGDYYGMNLPVLFFTDPFFFLLGRGKRAVFRTRRPPSDHRGSTSETYQTGAVTAR